MPKTPEPLEDRLTRLRDECRQATAEAAGVLKDLQRTLKESREEFRENQLPAIRKNFEEVGATTLEQFHAESDKYIKELNRRGELTLEEFGKIADLLKAKINEFDPEHIKFVSAGEVLGEVVRALK